MNILVTGGAGFIGSHLVDSLLLKGHSVTVLDNLSTGKRENINPDSEFISGDVFNRDTVEDIFTRSLPKAVYHFASQISVSRSFKEPGFDARENIIGTLNLLECCRKHGSEKFIFASSAAVYGNAGSLPVKESDCTEPISFYGLSKKTAEAYAELFRLNCGLGTSCLRFSNVYGPRQIPEGEAGVISIFIDKALSGEEPVIDGDGSQTRDFIYVEDVIRANLMALEGRSGIYNISTETACSVNELWDTIKRLSGTSAVATYGNVREGDIKHSYLSREAALEGLGWKPEFSLEDGLRHTIEYYRVNG